MVLGGLGFSLFGVGFFLVAVNFHTLNVALFSCQNKESSLLVDLLLSRLKKEYKFYDRNLQMTHYDIPGRLM